MSPDRSKREFEQQLSPLLDVLYGAALRMTRHHDDAEDLVQDTVVKAPREEEDLERLVLSHSPRFQAMLEQSRQSIEAGKGLSREAFWQAVEQRDAEKEPTRKR